MRRGVTISSLLLFLGACGEDRGISGPEVPVQSTNSSIAGRTLSCHAGGPPSNLTFAADGTISGRLLDRDVTGKWYVDEQGVVHTQVAAGPISVRDALRRTGGGWSGRTTTCAG